MRKCVTWYYNRGQEPIYTRHACLFTAKLIAFFRFKIAHNICGYLITWDETFELITMKGYCGK